MRRGPVFLERRSYRRRRALDGVRVLPFLGAVLFLLPLLWSAPPERVLGTAGSGVYLFGVWGFLIACAFAFAVYTGRGRGDTERDPAEAASGDPGTGPGQ